MIKNCLNCRFGTSDKFPCIHKNECTSTLDCLSGKANAPSHWQEFTDAQILEHEMLHKISEKKLIDDISGGCRYVDADLAFINESKRRAEKMDILQSYCEHDVAMCIQKSLDEIYKEETNMANNVFRIECESSYIQVKVPEIKKVIFSGHCTIVQWSDGDKTIVRCGEYEFFDKEKGLAMAICKKMLGTNKSKSNYNDIFKKWCKDE